jgi:hypothetical protein
MPLRSSAPIPHGEAFLGGTKRRIRRRNTTIARRVQEQPEIPDIKVFVQTFGERRAGVVWADTFCPIEELKRGFA